MAPEVAEQRIAVAAGGTVVDDSKGPRSRDTESVLGWENSARPGARNFRFRPKAIQGREVRAFVIRWVQVHQLVVFRSCAGAAIHLNPAKPRVGCRRQTPNEDGAFPGRHHWP